MKKEFDLIKYDLLDVIVEALVEKKYCYSIGVEGLHRELSIQSMNTEDLSYLIARTGIPLRVSEKRGWFYENQSYAQFKDMLLNFLTAQFTCCHYSYSCGGIYNQDSITIISSKEELLNKFCCSNNAEPIPEFVPPPPLIRINKTLMMCC